MATCPADSHCPALSGRVSGSDRDAIFFLLSPRHLPKETTGGERKEDDPRLPKETKGCEKNVPATFPAMEDCAPPRCASTKEVRVRILSLAKRVNSARPEFFSPPSVSFG